ncbi:MAG: DEAD/DEAH box helicase [Candidatus Scalindua sp.]|nr:DEAD/DEAH box helicase [Candidatus Scalindua sp.]
MKKIELELTNTIRISGQLPERVTRELGKRLIFTNPAYEQAEKFGRSVYGIPEKLSFIETSNGVTTIPRGFISQLIKIFDFNGVQYDIKNQLRRLPSVNFSFQGKLYPYQERAVEAILKKHFGILESPTGSGKTTMSLAVIAARRQSSLVVVHSKELLNQWQQRIEQFLGVPLEEIGLIGDGHTFDESKIIHVGIVNSLRKCSGTIKNFIGFLVVDECHRVPGSTFLEVVSKFDSAFMLGLSATPYRKDGLTKLIFFFIGDKRYTIETAELQRNNFIIRPELRVRETSFEFFYEDNYQEMLTELIEDEARNLLILETVVEHAANGQGVSLIISDRKGHCAEFFRLLVERGIKARLLTGSVVSDERRKIVEEIGEGSIDVVCATSQLISEGFDCKSLAAIHLAVPVGSSGKLIQSIGRIVRTASGKRGAVIFDYHDVNIGVLGASFNRRKRVYQELGIDCNIQQAFAAA